MRHCSEVRFDLRLEMQLSKRAAAPRLSTPVALTFGAKHFDDLDVKYSRPFSLRPPRTQEGI